MIAIGELVVGVVAVVIAYRVGHKNGYHSGKQCGTYEGYRQAIEEHARNMNANYQVNPNNH